MSGTKNVVIQQNNGTDYDKLHPETVDLKVNLTNGNVSVWGNTLKEALPKIDSRLKIQEENEWSVGDIKCSTKSSLGNKWLKCDGSTFDVKEYPELSNFCRKENFPFGNKLISIVKNDIPRKTMKGINEGNNLNQSDSYISYLNIVNNYYVRFKEVDSAKYSLTVYYSQDNFTWETGNTIELTTENTFLNGIKRIGYINGYYYIFFKVNGGVIAISNSISFDSYTLIKLEDVLKCLPDAYVALNGWDGRIYHTFSGEYSFLQVIRFGDNGLRILSIIGKDIFFSNPRYVEVVSEIDETGVVSIDSFVLNQYRYSICTCSYGKNATYTYMSKDSGGKAIDTGYIRGRSFWGNVVTNDYLYIYLKESEYYQFHRVKITANSTLSQMVEEDLESQYVLPSLIRKNNQFVRRDLKTGNVEWSVSDSPNMSNSQKYTDVLTRESFPKYTLAVFEDSSGVYAYTNNEEGNNSVYKLSFGRILPVSITAANTVTPINTFIKALD